MTLSTTVPGPPGPGACAVTRDIVSTATERLVPAPRLSASRVPAIKGMRLSPPGTEVTLINISATGTLVVCGRRLSPGSDVTVRFDGAFDPSSVPGRVVRCAVSAIGPEGGLKYEVGIEFSRRIELDDAPKPAAEPPEAPPSTTVQAPPSPVLLNRW